MFVLCTDLFRVIPWLQDVLRPLSPALRNPTQKHHASLRASGSYRRQKWGWHLHPNCSCPNLFKENVNDKHGLWPKTNLCLVVAGEKHHKTMRPSPQHVRWRARCKAPWGTRVPWVICKALTWLGFHFKCVQVWSWRSWMIFRSDRECGIKKNEKKTKMSLVSSLELHRECVMNVWESFVMAKFVTDWNCSLSSASCLCVIHGSYKV